MVYAFLSQAYTSQILSLVMFALMMSEDRVSMQARRKAIIDDLKILPGEVVVCSSSRATDRYTCCHGPHKIMGG